MSLEENKKIAESYHLEVIQNLNLDLADKIFTSDCMFHVAPNDARFSVRGPQQAKRMACNDQEVYGGAFKFIHSDQVAEENYVSYRWKVMGTSTTGELPLSQGIDFVRLENGKIAELWSAFGNCGEEQRRKGWEF